MLIHVFCFDLPCRMRCSYCRIDGWIRAAIAKCNCKGTGDCRNRSDNPFCNGYDKLPRPKSKHRNTGQRKAGKTAVALQSIHRQFPPSFGAGINGVILLVPRLGYARKRQSLCRTGRQKPSNE
jgi:hypothetical protein